MALAGYSGTPLPQKLGIKERHQVALVNAPDGFADHLGVLPTGATLRTGLGRGAMHFDVIVVFATKRETMVAEIATCRTRMHQAAGLWIAWPKKSSKVSTDIVEDTIREVALPTGLVDNKVCAIDETWSGLRLVIRKENRERQTPPVKKKKATAPSKPRRRASAR